MDSISFEFILKVKWEKPAALHKLEALQKQQTELDEKIDTAFKLRNVLAEQAGMEVIKYFEGGGYDED